MADQATEGLLSSWLRKKRFEYASPHLRGRVLDFGCGSGGLAELVPSDSYLGVDLDKLSLQKARLRYPNHHFISNLPPSHEKFDSIVSLAVIEHVRNPVFFLRNLVAHLNKTEESHLIVTTPHPSVDWIHDLGAAVGLFSKQANEEHQDLLNRSKLEMIGSKAGLKIAAYQRFLLGANQIIIYKMDH